MAAVTMTIMNEEDSLREEGWPPVEWVFTGTDVCQWLTAFLSHTKGRERVIVLMAGGCFLWGEGTVHIRQRRSFSFFSLRYAPALKYPEIRAPFSRPAISLSQFLASRNPVRHQPNMENVHIISEPGNLTSSDPPYLLAARVPYQARWHHQGYFKTPTKLLHSRMSCSPGNNVVVSGGANW